VTSRPIRLLGASVCAVALGLAAACGSSSAPAAPSASALPAPASNAPAAQGHDMPGMTGMEGMPGMSNNAVELYAVQTGTLGVVVTDGSGRVLYGSDQDANNPPASRCTGTCAQEWLPLVVPQGDEPDLEGVQPDQVGRVARDDGSSQLTLGGWPVYVNKNDTGELKAVAPDAHGTWFAMSPQGQKVAV
jgi:predicted lipoprotein with Yx(FWY)xxD motif